MSIGPSVTEVLGVYTDWSKIPPDVLEHACARGTAVHEVCAAIASGIPWMRAVPEEQVGYIKSFEAWMDAAVEEVVLVEKRLFDNHHGFHGKPDLVVRMKGDEGLSVPDLKTPATEQRVWRGQMAAYRHLVQERFPHEEVSRQFSLRLDRNGGLPRLKEYTGTYLSDWAAFLNALYAYNHFHA